MKIKSNFIFIFVGFLLIYAFIYTTFYTTEGFATLPAHTQVADIPQNMPGATTINPTQSLSQSKDVLDAVDSLQTYMKIAKNINISTTTLTNEEKEKAMFYKQNAPQLINDLNVAIENPSNFTVSQLYDIRNNVQRLTVALSSQPMNATNLQKVKDIEYSKIIESEPKPTTASGPVDAITMDELNNLVSRIQKEIDALSALRSSDPTMIARISQLTKLSGDVGDIIDSVNRKIIKIEEAPITPESAQLFLSSLEHTKSPLAPLIQPMGDNAPSIAEFVPQNDPFIQTLLNTAQDLKWSMNIRVEYDPTLERIEQIIKMLTNTSISNKPLNTLQQNTIVRDLQTIQKQVKPTHTNATVTPNMVRLKTGHTRIPTENRCTFPYADGTSPDVFVRPGFEMNDDQIAKRASASSFDESTVGGLDYKQRSLDLCRQIRQAQLGDTKSFGCIENPGTVGPNYSWKGNFTMVCNRLGDSWGRNYPEQFGCLPYDPTAKYNYSM